MVSCHPIPRPLPHQAGPSRPSTQKRWVGPGPAELGMRCKRVLLSSGPDISASSLVRT